MGDDARRLRRDRREHAPPSPPSVGARLRFVALQARFKPHPLQEALEAGSRLGCLLGPLLRFNDRSDVSLRRGFAPDHRHLRRRIAVAFGLDIRRTVVDCAQIPFGQFDVAGCDILLKAVELGRTGDGHDVRSLGQQPRQGPLAQASRLCVGDAPEQVDEGLILSIASGGKRGMLVRKSSCDRLPLLMAPVRKPFRLG